MRIMHAQQMPNPKPHSLENSHFNICMRKHLKHVIQNQNPTLNFNLQYNISPTRLPINFKHITQFSFHLSKPVRISAIYQSLGRLQILDFTSNRTIQFHCAFIQRQVDINTSIGITSILSFFQFRFSSISESDSISTQLLLSAFRHIVALPMCYPILTTQPNSV